MNVAAHKETLEFQTEIRQLLDLMIHSLYSNKEIFLRELISNASDACDKLRFEALSDDALYENDTALEINVAFDKTARTITVTDNGVGMNRNEVTENLGTIAHSGTKDFLGKLTGDQAKDAKLIGQFGVGFYSSFVVADRVTLVTRRAGLGPEHGVRWESDGSGSYSLETVERSQRGTEVTLHLRESEDEFLDDWRLRSVIHKYSDHISLPIVMKKPDADESETVNKASALWARPKSEISEQEYEEFYKHIAHDFEAPLAHVHSKIEGQQNYTSLLYIPSRAPFDLWDRNRRHGIKLYVRRVFIMDDAEQLMPDYLRFVRGVVDSDDLPLNISREILQHNKSIDAIRGACVKRVLGLLENLANDEPDKYDSFWQAFGRVLKEGPVEDHANRERVAKLLRFASTNGDSDKQDVSLDAYLSRMKEGQDKIYYITADSFATAKNSPHLEVFRDKGIEVLLMHDRIDEWLTTHLTEYQDKAFQSVAKGNLELDQVKEASKIEKREHDEHTFRELIDRMRATLGERVRDVRLTERLTRSPACLVVDENDISTNLERVLKSVGQKVDHVRPIMEINPDHPLVQKLGEEHDAKRFEDWVEILFDQSLLSEGGQLDDPASYVNRLNELILTLAGGESSRIIV